MILNTKRNFPGRAKQMPLKVLFVGKKSGGRGRSVITHQNCNRWQCWNWKILLDNMSATNELVWSRMAQLIPSMKGGAFVLKSGDREFFIVGLHIFYYS